MRIAGYIVAAMAVGVAIGDVSQGHFEAAIIALICLVAIIFTLRFAKREGLY